MTYNIQDTYVYFEVLDYNGTSTLSAYTLDITPLNFIPDFTTSNILSGTRIISNKNLRWDFGDGTFSTDLRPTHTYKWPGQYTVTLTIFDSDGNAYDSTFSCTVQIYDYISTQINFQDYRGLIYDVPAGRLSDPLYVNVYDSWQNYNALSGAGYTINLYASGAAGDYNYTPLDVTDKWDHLRSLSRFYRENKTPTGETEYLEIESLTAAHTEMYVKLQDNQIVQCNASDAGSVFVGITGTGKFWYTDERPNALLTENNPIIIFATLDNSKFNDAYTQRMQTFKYVDYPIAGFQNIEPAVFPALKVRFNSADRLSITTTGIDGEGTLSTTKFEIPNVSWQETEIPYVIKFKDKHGFTTKNYPPLSSSSANPSLLPPQFYNIETGISYLSGDQYYPLEGVKFYEDFTRQSPQSLGAFYKGYFVSSQSSENCILTAGVVVIEPPHYEKDSLLGWVLVPQYNSAIRVLREVNYNEFTHTKTVTLINDQSVIPVADNRNAFAAAVSPVGTDKSSDDYETWFADAVNDRIFKYDVYGNPVENGVYNLSAVPTLINNQIVDIDYRTTGSNLISAAAAPNGIVIDRDENIWVTLLESGSAIKIDSTRNVVTAVATPSGATNFSYTLSADYLNNQGFAGENLILPSSIDTDRNNDIWITYTHPIFNYLIKYQGTNNFTIFAETKKEIQFPAGIAPVEVCIDRNNYVWVTARNHNVRGSVFGEFNDYLYKFDLDGNIQNGYPLSGFQQIGNITVDGSQNAWVSHDRELITKVDAFTNERTDYIAGVGNNKTNYICSIGGITCDTSNNIWVINNFDRKLYMINGNTIPQPQLSYVTVADLVFPSAGLPVLSSYTTPIEVLPNQYSDGLQEFQATGDWNGYRWINKYAAPVTTVRTITGSSNLFNIYPSSGKYGIAKINESWDASGYYNSLRYQESLLDKEVFFDKFLGVIVGNAASQPYELGKTIYEKIANFVDNKADVDKVNIDSLLSLCKELTIDFEEYNYLYPPQLKRIVDMLSIKQSKLWGSRNKYALNFDNRGTTMPNDTYGINLSAKLDITSSYIVPGIPIVAKELFSDVYTVVNTNYFTESTIPLPLSSYTPSWGWGLTAPASISGTEIGNYYNFYQYNSKYSDEYYDNVIDWNSVFTTLTPTNSSYDAWSTDDGIIQNILSYELTKGFRLFTSGVDVTYNS